VTEKNKVGYPRRTWMKDRSDWTGLSTYWHIKRMTEKREEWKRIVVNLRLRKDDR